MFNYDLNNKQQVSNLVYLHSNLNGLSNEFPINEITITFNDKLINIPSLQYFNILINLLLENSEPGRPCNPK